MQVERMKAEHVGDKSKDRWRIRVVLSGNVWRGIEQTAAHLGIEESEVVQIAVTIGLAGIAAGVLLGEKVASGEMTDKQVEAQLDRRAQEAVAAATANIRRRKPRPMGVAS